MSNWCRVEKLFGTSRPAACVCTSVVAFSSSIPYFFFFFFFFPTPENDTQRASMKGVL
jgi:hypothetical protein